MTKLIEEIDILFIQEYWHCESNIGSLIKSMDNIQVHGPSGICSDVRLGGLPYCGCCFFFV